MEENRTPQQIMYDIQSAYKDKNKSREDIMSIYRAIPDKSAISTDRNRSYLHLAAEFADYQAIEYLLSEGVKPLMKNAYNETALHSLAQESNDRYAGRENNNDEAIKKSAKLLLDARVSALLRDEGAGGNLCYHAGMKAHNIGFIYAMIENKVKLDMLDKEGCNLLHLLILYPAKNAQHSLRYSNNEEDKAKHNLMLEECFKLAEALIESGIDPQAKDQRGFTAADHAVEHELNRLAVLLKGEYDSSDLSLEDRITAGGMTLHQATGKGNSEAVTALLRLGSDPNETDTTPYGEYQNMMPLAISASRGHIECVKALLEGGADPNFRGGESGRGVFFYFVTKIRRYSSQQERDKVLENILKMLFDYGLEPNGIVDEMGHTPLNLVCSKQYGSGDYQTIIRRELLDMGVCDYNMPDNDGTTPLMGIAGSRDSGVENDLIALLEFGADMSARDSRGNTVLMHAAMNRDRGNALTVADLLFSFGDPLPILVNNDGKSAMDLAMESDNEDFVKFILGKI